MVFKEILKATPNMKSRFSQGVIWNFLSLIILGISGILANILIAKYYGAEILGVFNQVFAFYILASQIAVWGIHFSVLKHVPQFAKNKKQCNSIISSSLVLTIVLSILVAIIIWFLKGAIGSFLDSPGVARAIPYIIPAIVFFALNKLLLHVLNGFRHMKNYAFSTALRYILLLVFSVIAILLNFPGHSLPIIFTFSEFLVFCWLIVNVRNLYSFTLKDFRKWTRIHFVFGTKIVLSGALFEVNTRVDILMLGIFTSDKTVGVYSLASIIAEGVSMIYMAVKANVNPILTKLYFQKKIKRLREIIKKGVSLFYLFMLVVVLIAIALYPVFLNIFIKDPSFIQSWYVFMILMTGILLSSGYLPFNQILAQTGFPGYYTLMISSVIVVNIILNLALIPLLGIYGAAIATASSFIFSILVLKIMVKKLLGFSI